MTKQFTAEIRALMARKRLSASDLANALGISTVTVYRRLDDKADWQLADLPIVAEFLGVEVADLLPAVAKAESA